MKRNFLVAIMVAITGMLIYSCQKNTPFSDKIKTEQGSQKADGGGGGRKDDDGGIIIRKVVSRQNQVLPGVQVQFITGQDSSTQVTNSAGEVTFQSLAEQVRMTINHPGYSTVDTTIANTDSLNLNTVILEQQ